MSDAKFEVTPTIHRETLSLPAGSTPQTLHCLQVKVDFTAGDTKKVMLRLPSKEWMSGAPRQLLEAVADTAGRTWRLTPVPDGLNLERTNSPKATTAFSLTFRVLLARQDGTLQGARVCVDSLASGTTLRDLPLKADAPSWTVRLRTNPLTTTSLAYGQEVTLSWTLENIDGDATLRGNLPGGLNQVTIDSKTGHVKLDPKPSSPITSYVVYALRSTAYELTAFIKGEGGVRQEVVHRVSVDLHEPNYGVQTFLWPSRVFSGGPVACFYRAFQVSELSFLMDEFADSVPSLEKHGKQLGVVDNSKGSFTLRWGPQGEGQRWSLATEFEAVDPRTGQSVPREKAVSAAVAAVSSRRLGPAEIPGGTVLRGVAAGQFRAVVMNDKPTSSTDRAREKPMEWLALATTKGLKLYSFWGSEQRVQRDVQDLMEGVDCLGVSAVSDRVAVAYKDPGQPTARLALLDLPGAKWTTKDKDKDPELPAELGAWNRLRMVSLGTRVYLLGGGQARSFDWKKKDGFVAEPRLVAVASPSWEVTAVGPAGSGGCLFALNTSSGLLLRFDLLADPTAGQGTLDEYRAAEPANHKLAKLDLLQQAQLNEGLYLDGNKAYNLQEVPGKDGKPEPVRVRSDKLVDAKEQAQGRLAHERALWEWDAKGVINKDSELLNVGGALLARSDRPDPRAGDAIQDRAYDPRLNVWVRCGHPFPGVQTEGAFFATTRASIYCVGTPISEWQTPGAPAAGRWIWRISGPPLLPLLGFVTRDVTPIARNLLKQSAWRGHLLRQGEKLAAGEFLQSKNGEYRLAFENDRLTLRRMRTGAVQWTTDTGNDYLVLGGEPRTMSVSDKAASLELKDDGRLVAQDSTKELWQPPRCIGDRLPMGMFMAPGDSLESPDKKYKLEYKSDGNLVLSDVAGTQHWESKTAGKAPHRVFVQSNGDLYITGPSAVHWKGSENYGIKGEQYAGSTLVLGNDGRLVVRARSDSELWAAAPSRGDSLLAGQWMYPGDQLVSGVCRLVYQCDGNLVLYQGGNAIWWTGTCSLKSHRVRLLETGHLVVYNASHAPPIWTTETHGGAKAEQAGDLRLKLDSSGGLTIVGGTASNVLWDRAQWKQDRLTAGSWLSPGQYLETNGSCRLIYQRDGDLVLFDKDGKQVWAAGTADGQAGKVKLTGEGDLVVERSNGSIAWRASDHGGVVPGKQFQSGVLRVSEHGFSVESNDGKWWYSVTAVGGRYPDGRGVRLDAPGTRYYICNLMWKEYLFAQGRAKRDDGSSWVGGHPDGTHAGQSDDIWIVTEVRKGQYTIYNEKHDEYLYSCETDSHCGGKIHRHIFTNKADQVFQSDTRLKRALWQFQDVVRPGESNVKKIKNASDQAELCMLEYRAGGIRPVWTPYYSGSYDNVATKDLQWEWRFDRLQPR